MDYKHMHYTLVTYTLLGPPHPPNPPIAPGMHIEYFCSITYSQNILSYRCYTIFTYISGLSASLGEREPASTRASWQVKSKRLEIFPTQSARSFMHLEIHSWYRNLGVAAPSGTELRRPFILLKIGKANARQAGGRRPKNPWIPTAMAPTQCHRLWQQRNYASSSPSSSSSSPSPSSSPSSPSSSSSSSSPSTPPWSSSPTPVNFRGPKGPSPGCKPNLREAGASRATHENPTRLCRHCLASLWNNPSSVSFLPKNPPLPNGLHGRAQNALELTRNRKQHQQEPPWSHWLHGEKYPIWHLQSGKGKQRNKTAWNLDLHGPGLQVWMEPGDNGFHARICSCIAVFWRRRHRRKNCYVGRVV